MKQLMMIWIVAAALLMGGCSSLTGGDNLDHAGITSLTAEPALAEKDKFARFGDRVVYKSGKEANALHVVIDLDKDGQGNPAPVRVEITAGDVRAFEGQAIRNDAVVKETEAVSDTVESVAPVVGDVIKAVINPVPVP